MNESIDIAYECWLKEGNITTTKGPFDPGYKPKLKSDSDVDTQITPMLYLESVANEVSRKISTERSKQGCGYTEMVDLLITFPKYSDEDYALGVFWYRKILKVNLIRHFRKEYGELSIKITRFQE